MNGPAGRSALLALALLISLGLAAGVAAASGGVSTGGGNGGGGNGGGVHVPGTHVSIPPLPTTSVPPVDQTLTLAQATLQCTLDGINQLLQPQAFQTCLNNYMNP